MKRFSFQPWRCHGAESLALPALWMLAGLLFSAPSTALDRDRDLDQFHHTGWTSRDGVPPDIRSMAQTKDGWLWLASSRGLYRFDGVRFEPIIPTADGEGSASAVESLFAAPDGALWIRFESGDLEVLRDGRFSAGKVEDQPSGHAPETDRRGIRRIVEIPRVPTGSPQQSSPSLLDRDGALWTIAKPGVCRVAFPDRVPPGAPDGPLAFDSCLTTADGLTSDRTLAILEDREGSIWVSTRAGLDRIRSGAAVPIRLPGDQEGFSLAAAPDGAVWVTASSSPDGARWSVRNRPERLPDAPAAAFASYADGAGHLWLAGKGRLWNFTNGLAPNETALPGEVGQSEIRQLLRDGTGDLWVSAQPGGLFRLHETTWSANGGFADLPKEVPGILAAGGAGQVLFGYPSNQVAILRGGKVHLFSGADGLDLGAVTALSDGSVLVAGGEKGLQVLQHGRWESLPSGGPAFRGVTGLLQTREGDLWVNGSSGAFRIPALELQRYQSDATHRVAVEGFDAEDGLPGTAVQEGPLPSLIQSADGRLWFSQADGIAWIDPAHLQAASSTPSVVIRGVNVGTTRYANSRDLRLPRGTTTLQIDYTALGLSVPERARFRYRLEGVDTQWQEAGARRQAFYTNLGAGAFRFEVEAANGVGAWSANAGNLAFVIEPTFFETGWFHALCGLAAFIVLWLAYLVRLRQMTLRLRARLEERYDERERIARELHDTLLQGVQGLILRFHVLAERSSDPALRTLIEQTLDRADVVLEDGRDRVRHLRDLAHPINDLGECFAAVGRELSDIRQVAFRVHQIRSPRELDPLSHDEIFQIGREALFNAFQHSGAKSIEVEIAYDRAELRLRVRDDGRGIAPDVLDAGGRTGHWGLTGMRERAAKIRGKLDIWSRDGSGTEIDLRVPGATAYRRVGTKAWLLRTAGKAVAMDAIP